MADELRAQYDALKADDPGRILLFAVAGGRILALGADAAELDRLLAGAVPTWAGGPIAGPAEVLAFELADLERVLSLIVAAGRRAAVLERFRGKPPKGAEVERVVTPGRIEDA